ncbi:MAG: MBL fold metallo-hydrolase [Halobacteriales archaeon]
MVINLAKGLQTFTSNAFLVTGERTVLVDAGSNFDIEDGVSEHSDSVDTIVLTHTHPDHIGNLSEAKAAFGVDAWGFDEQQTGVDHSIRDGETICLGDDDYTAVHTPGHKDDHLCFYSAAPGVLFCGDLVFQNGSFGRTDVPGGDRETLIASLDTLLEHLDESLQALHPGHGPSVTENPYRHVELARRYAEEF